MDKERRAHFEEYIDTSWIATFPPGFFQKLMDHTRAHPGEEVSLQITKDRLYLRQRKGRKNGVSPKDPINGRIISWCSTTIRPFEQERVEKHT